MGKIGGLASHHVIRISGANIGGLKSRGGRACSNLIPPLALRAICVLVEARDGKSLTWYPLDYTCVTPGADPMTNRTAQREGMGIWPLMLVLPGIPGDFKRVGLL